MSETSVAETVVDADARLAALNIEKSFCVSAPAGSGKTELLTQRFLKLLAQVENPEQIQAITFTRKAAAEMRERIVQALRVGKNSEPPSEQHRYLSWQLAQQALQQSAKHDWQLLDNPQRLRIQTIDSLCHAVARDQPVLSQIGGSLQPVDNAKPLYERAIDNFFDELESSSDIASDIALLLYHLDNNAKRLKDLFVQMLPLRDQWLPSVNFVRQESDVDSLLDETLEKWISEELNHTRSELAHAAGDLVLCADFAASFLQENSDISPDSPVRLLAELQELPNATPQQHQQWRGIVTLLLTNDFKPRKRLDKKLGFPAKSDKLWGEKSQHFKQQMAEIIENIAENDDLLYRLKTIAMLPASGYAKSDKPLLNALTHCLVQLCGQLELVYGESQQCDHNEIAIRALRALGSQNGDTIGSATAYKWSQQLRHLLVDEFQDTSERQFELIETLTEDWPHYNAQTGVVPNSLFIVGDGMQSIYSFREAKVGLFLQAKTQGIGGLKLEPINLQQNFRSTPAIVEWVNQHFAQAFPLNMNRSQGAVPYSASVSFDRNVATATANKIDDESAVEVIACIKDAESNAANLAEANHIVAAIKTAFAQEENTEIAILVRARSHLKHILPALDAADIIWQGVDIDPLAQREVIMDCMTLVNALSNPADNIAWYALLRAPSCGLQLVDMQVIKDCLALDPSVSFLANYMCAASSADYSKLAIQLQALMSKDGWLRFQHLCSVVERAWQSRAKNSFRHWIESTWKALGGEYMAAYSANGNDANSAAAFFELLETLEQNEGASALAPDIEQLRRKVESLYAKSPAMHTLGRPPVQIMTMHKAKGLEYDMVLLPGLHTASVASAKPLLITHTRIFDDGSVGLALSAMQKPALASNSGGQGNTPIYEFLREQEKRLKSYELLRLLYVAATRARTKLMLFAVLEETPDGLLKEPGRGSLLAPLWPTLKANVSCVHSNVESSIDEALDVDYLQLSRFKLDELQRLQNKLTLKAVGDLEPPVETDVVITALPYVDESRSARILGTCAHEILEQIAKLGLSYWQQKPIAEVKPYWKVRLSSLGMPGEEIASAVEVIEKAIDKLLASKNSEILFSEQHRNTHAEWALTHYEGEQVQRMVLDWSFVDNANVRWIVDYKMSQPTENQPLQKFLNQQVLLYAEKMQQYHSAVQLHDMHEQLQVKQTKCALYFPLIDTLHEIDLRVIAGAV
jgi:ATP-dependent exoDNAse (exonuclease V) beta subunit